MTADLQHLQAIGKKMARYTSASVFAAGLKDYERGLVTDMREHGGTVTALAGAEWFQVLLDLDMDRFLAKSTCSCGTLRFCRHMAAVFYQLLSGQGDPEQFQRELGRHTVGWHGSPPNSGDGDVLQPEQSYESWLRYFKEVWEWEGGAGPVSARSATFLVSRMNDLAKAAADWASPVRQAYMLSVYLFFLSAALAAPDEVRPAWQTGIISPKGLMMSSAAGGVNEVVNGASPEDLEAVARGYGSAIAEQARGLVAGSGHSPGLWCTGAYRLVWHKVLHHSDLLESEIRRMEELSEQSAEFSQALAYLYILEGRDLEARGLLEGVPRAARFEIVETVLAVLEDAQVERFHSWMQWIAPPVPGYDPYMDRLNAFWSYLVDRRPEAGPDYEAYLVTHLPYSNTDYRRYLLQIRQYRLWAEQYLQDGSFPPNISTEELRMVERQSRETLLPLYHQGIESSVREKNRKGYKTAVRLLVKLRANYRKLKRERDWNRYIAQFSLEHARQRALMEEMRQRRIVE